MCTPLRQRLMPSLRGCTLGLAMGLLAACDVPSPAAIRDLAEPDAAPMRTVTSFTAALACLDEKLAAARRPRILLSSSEITDFTRSVAVSADDMLVNAISQMNRRSGTYVFLDQARTRKDGMVDLVIARPGREPRPALYIRGAISQHDTDVLRRQIDVLGPAEGGREAGLSTLGGGFVASVVAVDLHLVRYPSRQVIPGSSVSNSIVITRRFGSAALTGTIQADLPGLRFRVDRMESPARAVRNLIELGVIELLGRHSGVAYTECLFSDVTAAQGAAQAEEAAKRIVPAPGHPVKEAPVQPDLAPTAVMPPTTQPTVAAPAPRAGAAARQSDPRLTPERIRALQAALILAGYLAPPSSGQLDAATVEALRRMQRAQRLPVTGQPDEASETRLKKLIGLPARSDG